MVANQAAAGGVNKVVTAITVVTGTHFNDEAGRIFQCHPTRRGPHGECVRCSKCERWLALVRDLALTYGAAHIFERVHGARCSGDYKSTTAMVAARKLLPVHLRSRVSIDDWQLSHWRVLGGGSATDERLTNGATFSLLMFIDVAMQAGGTDVGLEGAPPDLRFWGGKDEVRPYTMASRTITMTSRPQPIPPQPTHPTPPHPTPPHPTGWCDGRCWWRKLCQWPGAACGRQGV